MSKGEESHSPLGGITVLDLADQKGSFCSRLLADMGARVIKIEKPGGDPWRRIGPFPKDVSHPEKNLSSWYNNCNKEDITLDFENPEGRSILLRLVGKVDVVVETFPPGHMKGLGLEFIVLSEVNPGIILASITGFGQSGPHSSYKPCDLVACAYGGQMYVTGLPSSPPLQAFGGQSYFMASLWAATGVLLALRQRRQGGKGQHLDISLQEAVASSLEQVMVRYFYEGVVTRRPGTQHQDNPSTVLPCQDGFLLMTFWPQWETLVEWMEGEGMAGDLRDSRYLDPQYRRQNHDHIVEVVGRWTKTHTVQELFELGQLMHFPWAPVCPPRGVIKSPQLGGRRFFKEAYYAQAARMVPCPSLPFLFSRYEPAPLQAAPLPGQDNLKIYREELGLPDSEMERLASLKVI